MTRAELRNRKLDHIDLALERPTGAGMAAQWDGVHLRPVALPGLDIDAVDLSARLFGRSLAAPIMIAGMTGGHPQTTQINANLAAAAQACGIAMGVGSQRAALSDPTLAGSFSVVRKSAPDALILANIGISQLVLGTMRHADDIARLIDMVQADAVAVHINLLQELVQPEGEITLSRALGALEQFIADCPCPVMVKETGCGMDLRTALRLRDIGAAALDTGGSGGTSFVRIEGVRAARNGDTNKARLADTFAGWGLSTIQSLREIRAAGLPIVATGGIRNGLDVAKALALGADIVGIGRQILGAAVLGEQECITELRCIIRELSIAMVLTESATLNALKDCLMTEKDDG